MENGRGIVKSEGHANKSIQAIMGREGGLIAIKWVDLDFTITYVGVQSREDGCITERVYEIVHSKDRVRVKNCYRAEPSVIK